MIAIVTKEVIEETALDMRLFCELSCSIKETDIGDGLVQIEVCTTDPWTIQRASRIIADFV